MKYAVPFACVFTAGVVLHLIIAFSTGQFSTAPKLQSNGQALVNKVETTDLVNDLSHADNLRDIYNMTLGFQEIFVISLPHRSDRRDAIAVQAGVTNLAFTFMDAVAGQDVPEKALPYTMHRDPAEVGCWRSHLNVMQHMVQNNIQSALFFEDGADWDVALREQMVQAALGTRWLLSAEEDLPSHSPYGDKWDLLWLGHRGVDSNRTIPSDRRRWVIPQDPTVVPPKTRSIWFEPDMKEWESGPSPDPQTRIFFVSGLAYGSASWAVSLSGAKKVINELSLNPYNDPIDAGMGKLCMEQRSNMTCVAPFPAVVGVSKPAGPLSHGSDILVNLGDQVRKKAITEGVVFSTRLNIKRMLSGQTEFESFYPNSTGPTMEIDQIRSAQGHGWIRPEKDTKS
jgi:GR25 family glycosyltransferase involved in LPS biosynthesis